LNSGIKRQEFRFTLRVLDALAPPRVWFGTMNSRGFDWAWLSMDGAMTKFPLAGSKKLH
jgi:hypothetical protein